MGTAVTEGLLLRRKLPQLARDGRGSSQLAALTFFDQITTFAKELVNFIVYVIFANSIQPIKEFGGNPTITIGFANVSRQKKANCSRAGPLGWAKHAGLLSYSFSRLSRVRATSDLSPIAYSEAPSRPRSGNSRNSM